MTANPLGCLSLNEFLCMLPLFFPCQILFGSGNFSKEWLILLGSQQHAYSEEFLIEVYGSMAI